MSVDVRVLKAFQGDCIWIRYGNITFTNIVIDSGPSKFKNKFKELIDVIEKKNENIDLLVFTHIDEDHIGGACKVLVDKGISCDCIKKIWINTPTAIRKHFNLKEYQGVSYDINVSNTNQAYSPYGANDLIDIIIERNIDAEQLLMVSDNSIDIEGAEIIILSPTKNELEKLVKKWGKYGVNTEFSSESYNEVDIDTINEEDKFNKDKNPYNGSSIAFTFKFGDVSLVLLGDAYADIVDENMKTYYKDGGLTVDLIKLSHHGSSSNTNSNLLSKFNCSNYVISSNGSNSNPDKRTIARLIKSNNSNNVNLYSNYNWWENKNYFTESDKEKYINTKIVNRLELSSHMAKIKEGLSIGNGWE